MQNPPHAGYNPAPVGEFPGFEICKVVVDGDVLKGGVEKGGEKNNLIKILEIILGVNRGR